MFEIGALSGQAYVDEYANKKPDEAGHPAPARAAVITADRRPRPTAADARRRGGEGRLSPRPRGRRYPRPAHGHRRHAPGRLLALPRRRRHRGRPGRRHRAGPGQGRGRRRGQRRGAGPGHAAGRRRRRGHRHRLDATRAATSSATRRPTSWPRPCSTCSPGPRSASARRSRTASTTTSSCPTAATFTPDDLERIDARMREIIEEKQPFVRDEIPDDEAQELFADHPFKLEIIDGHGRRPHVGHARPAWSAPTRTRRTSSTCAGARTSPTRAGSATSS